MHSHPLSAQIHFAKFIILLVNHGRSILILNWLFICRKTSYDDHIVPRHITDLIFIFMRFVQVPESLALASVFRKSHIPGRPLQTAYGNAISSGFNFLIFPQPSTWVCPILNDQIKGVAKQETEFSVDARYANNAATPDRRNTLTQTAAALQFQSTPR